MTKFVKVINNKVIQIIVANQEHINTLEDKDFYIEDDGTRVNKPGIRYTYDALRNAFIPPKPFNSWLLNETTCNWEAPIPMPEDKNTVAYSWNENDYQADNTTGWQQLTID